MAIAAVGVHASHSFLFSSLLLFFRCCCCCSPTCPQSLFRATLNVIVNRFQFHPIVQANTCLRCVLCASACVASTLGINLLANMRHQSIHKSYVNRTQIKCNALEKWINRIDVGLSLSVCALLLLLLLCLFSNNPLFDLS